VPAGLGRPVRERRHPPGPHRRPGLRRSQAGRDRLPVPRLTPPPAPPPPAQPAFHFRRIPANERRLRGPTPPHPTGVPFPQDPGKRTPVGWLRLRGLAGGRPGLRSSPDGGTGRTQRQGRARGRRDRGRRAEQGRRRLRPFAGPVAAAQKPSATTTAAPAGRAGSAAAPALLPTPACDPATGRLAVPSRFAPPCVPSVASNGGATWPGVTAETITVAVYLDRGDVAARALSAAAGNRDTADEVAATYRSYAEYFEHHYQTWGRRVRLEFG